MNLDEIEARANAASPGPWYAYGSMLSGIPSEKCGPYGFDHLDNLGYDHDGVTGSGSGIPNHGHSVYTAIPFDKRDDAEFCASARADIPLLCLEVRRLMAQNAEMARGTAALVAQLAERDARITKLTDALKSCMYGLDGVIASTGSKQLIACYEKGQEALEGGK